MFHQKRPRHCVARRFHVAQWPLWGLVVLTVAVIGGCGTTRISDTLRTGTEQILLSSAIDQSVSQMDFAELEGKDVYFDPQYLKGVSDEGYIISSIRQRLLAEGVFLKSARDEATYVVEARAGAVGTNRQDVLIGVPQTNLPTSVLTAGAPAAIPEIPLAKKTHQKGVAKIAVFAYNQVTGQALWQSGMSPIVADARDTWVFGTGPFQRGSIYNGNNYSGQRVLWPFGGSKGSSHPIETSGIPVNVSQTFSEDPDLIPPSPPDSFAKKRQQDKVVPASFVPGIPPAQPQTGRIPSPVPPTSTTPASTSGFNSNTFNISGAHDTQGSSGGNAAAAAAAGAAGVLFYKNSAAK